MTQMSNDRKYSVIYSIFWLLVIMLMIYGFLYWAAGQVG